VADTFQFELVAPEKLIYSDDIEFVVVPGAEGDWTVRYTTPQDEHAEATLTVVSTDFTSPETVVRLVAEGIAPTVRIDPATVDMGALDSATAALVYGPICVLKGSVLAAIE